MFFKFSLSTAGGLKDQANLKTRLVCKQLNLPSYWLLAREKFKHLPKDAQVKGPRLLSAGKHLTAVKLNEMG
jgi:hypothetical protein